MIWINLFMAVCMWIFLPIVYVSMRNNTIPKNGIILSVTLPPEGQTDSEVQAYLAAFRKNLRRTSIMLTIVLLPSLFLPQLSLSTTWSILWLLAALFVIFRCYAKGYAGLKAIKRRRGWQIAAAAQVAAEPASLKLPKPVKTGWFVPPMLLSILPVISVLFDELDPAWAMLLTVNAIVCLSITALSLLSYGLIFRQKPDVVDENTDRSAALTRIRRYNWTKTWLLLAWLTGLYSIATWIGQGRGYLVITLVYSAAILVVTLVTEFAARRAQHRLNGDAVPVVDEDDYWIWGQFYYNPHDKKVFINERVGMGMSMNYATTAGKAMAIFAVLVLLAMIPMCGWLIAEELTDISLGYTQEIVIARHLGTTYEIAMEDVIYAELLEELPPSSKIWGTGMEYLLKGSFSVEGYGAAKLCLDPHAPPFLMLKTAEETYFFSGKQTEDIYRTIHPDQ